MKSVLVNLISIKVVWSTIQGTRVALISAEGSSGPILIFLRIKLVFEGRGEVSALCLSHLSITKPCLAWCIM